jgi:histidinol-phosphate aminotransferase
MTNDKIRKLRRLAFNSYLIFQKIFRKIVNKLFPTPLPQTHKAVSKDSVSALDNAVVVITGSSSGIGRSLAEAFAAAGSSVVINGRNEASLNLALNKLKGKYSNVAAIKADVSQYEGAKKLIEQSIQKFGKIDVLINNAAMPGPIDKKIWDISLKEWQDVIDNDLTSSFLCSKELIHWAETNQHRVRIINVSSGIVNYGAPNLGAYNVAKMGVEGLTTSIAADCSNDNLLVSVVSIRPRSVRTEMTKKYYSKVEYGLMDDPEVLSPIFLYAASAPFQEIMGKSLSEPAFSADPKGEIVLNNLLSPVRPLRIEPEIFKRDSYTKKLDKVGAYMHLLQNPLGFYPSVAETISKNIYSRDLHGYPDPAYTELRVAVSQHTGIKPNYITFSNGSSELIDRAMRTFSGTKGNIIITRPTWGSVVWPSFQRCGLGPIEVPYLGTLAQKNIRHDLEGILNMINHETKLIYLVNPCNPTGSIVDKNDLKNFLYSVPSHVTVILDEAYIDYCEPAKRFNLPETLDNIPCRVIGLRTFSKFYALSGFRIGYAYGMPEVIDYIDRLALPFNVSNISQFAAITALKDSESQEKTYNNNLLERQRICKELDRLNIFNMPSQTNFILFDCPLDREKMRAALKEEGIFMPHLDALFSSNNYTITTVGLPEHNQKILDFLSGY